MIVLTFIRLGLLDTLYKWAFVSYEDTAAGSSGRVIVAGTKYLDFSCPHRSD